MIIEKGQPLSNVEDDYWRTLVYRSHGVNNISSPVCKRTVGEVILELMTRVKDSIKDELVCVLLIFFCFLNDIRCKLIYVHTNHFSFRPLVLASR